VQNGRYFGGGMKITPSSNRRDREMELCVIHSVNFFKLLLIFPLIFLGKHMWFKQVGISVVKGKHFILKADIPQAFQSDGEVVKDVREFEASISE
jgi:diacylglycerol kinase family enzyme